MVGLHTSVLPVGYVAEDRDPIPILSVAPAHSSGRPGWCARWAVEVEDWAQHLDLPVLEHEELPAALVNLPVVAGAEQDQVVEVGGAIVDPVHDVVRPAPAGRPRTPRGPALLVTDLPCPALARGDAPRLPARVDEDRARPA